MLSRTLIEEFRTIVREDYHKELSYEQARSIAEGITGYYDILAHINHRLNLKKIKDERYYRKIS